MIHESINYVEFQTTDIALSKAFFESVFSWTFTDYGDEYTAFQDKGLSGGMYASDAVAATENGSALIVFYSGDLESTLEKVLAAGGEIVKPTFSFPGGRRFHFREPGGNELAVWSDG